MINVKAAGATGDGTTVDTAAFQAAINAVSAAGGGEVFVPSGNYNVAGGLILPSNVLLLGEDRNATVIQCFNTDSTVITANGSRPSIRNLSIFGKGLTSGTFGAGHPTLLVTSVEGVFRDIIVWGGQYAIQSMGTDNYFENVNASFALGSSCVYTNGADWYIRCKFDHDPTGIAPTTAQPYPNWAATHAYTVGQIVIVGAYAIQCSVAGTSGSSPPALQNYLVPIHDGGVTWLLVEENGYAAMTFFDSGGENHIYQSDLSGPYAASILFGSTGGSGPPVAVFTDCVLSSPISLTSISATAWFRMSGCEIAGGVAINPGYLGNATINGNWANDAVTIAVAANVNGFIITNNILPGGAINVAVGTSNHYVISGNVGATVTDGGSGGSKSVTGNV